jgi:hypothetical protein
VGRESDDAPPHLPNCWQEPDGEPLEAHFKANRSAGVLRWVFQFGVDAIMFSPPDLKDEMAAKKADKKAETAALRYPRWCHFCFIIK